MFAPLFGRVGPFPLHLVTNTSSLRQFYSGYTAADRESLPPCAESGWCCCCFCLTWWWQWRGPRPTAAVGEGGVMPAKVARAGRPSIPLVLLAAFSSLLFSTGQKTDRRQGSKQRAAIPISTGDAGVVQQKQFVCFFLFDPLDSGK